MELLFESRPHLAVDSGKLLVVQGKATLHPDPVVPCDTYFDKAGASVMSVLRDAGVYRMWYYGFPADWGGSDAAHMCYAESDNGIDWRKPKLNVMKDSHGPSHRLNMLVTGVFVDPDSPASHRYRGVTFLNPNATLIPLPVKFPGYYTAHSADGLHWELDGLDPRWPEGDVILAAYHPAQRRGIVSYKRNPRYQSIQRRAVWIAGFADGKWDDGGRALTPDEFDDICAMSRGYASGDYYGLSFQPAGASTVGFLQQFRHSRPLTPGVRNPGVFGVTDLSLVYQESPRDAWQHAPGRLDFVDRGNLWWSKGGLYPASAAVETDGEHRLYIAGQGQSHAWYLEPNWKLMPRWKDAMREKAEIAQTGYAHWHPWRLFGFRADPEGVLQIHLGNITQPSTLELNCECEPGGSIRVAIAGVEGCGLEDAIPVTGNHTRTKVAWRHATTIPASDPMKHVVVNLHIGRATAWAYQFKTLES